MSRWGRILFFVAGISLAIVLAVRYVLGGWVDPLYFPLILAGVCFVGAFVLDFRLYLEFFTMRTTKHGLNMGSMIVLVLAGLVTVNFLSVQKNKVVDLTEEQLFSLSQQSVDVLKSVQQPIKVTVLYRAEKAKEALTPIRETLRLYQDASSLVSVELFDAYVENVIAQEYLNSLPDKDSAQNKVFVFVEHQGKRERINQPFQEAEISSAIIKVTRKSSKTVYFLTGHGERDIESEGEEGFRALKDELERYAAKVEKINLLEGAKIPDGASALVIAGPKAPLLDPEIEAIRAYAAAGGHLLIMADPGEKHNLSTLLTPMGLEFSNTYVVNGGVQIQGGSPLMAVGLEFDKESEITKPFMAGNSFTLFFLAAEIRKSPVAPSELKISELVKTTRQSMTVSELSPKAKQGETRAYSMAASVRGKLKGNDGKPGDKEFAAVVFGDSDFASNKFIEIPTNLNLILNSVAELTGETDLISIRPKQPKMTKLVLTNAIWLGVVGAGVLLPTLILVAGSVVWFRRRSA